MKNKPYKSLFLLIGILVLLCLISILYLMRFPQQEKNYTAYIYVDGVLYETIPLQTISSPYRFRITTAEGHFNEITVSPGAICISKADCPDLICVKQGTITHSLLPITCLPHKLVIELKENNTPVPNTPDAIAH